MSDQVLLLCFIFSTSAILLLNILVIILYIKVHPIRSRSNKLAVSSAVCCVFIAIAFIPVNVNDDFDYGKPIYWETALKGHITAFHVTLLLFNTAALSYDRYISIVYGMHYDLIMTAEKIRMIIFQIWLCPMVVSVLPLVWSLTVSDERIVVLLFNVYQGLLSAMILLVLMWIIVLYINIYLKQRHHWQSEIKTKVQRKRFSRSKEKPSSAQLFEQKRMMTVSIKSRKTSVLEKGHSGKRFSLSEIELHCKEKIIDRKLCAIKSNQGFSFPVMTLSSKLHSLRLFILIFSINILCWLPIVFINFCEATRIGALIPHSVVTMSKFSYLGNCIINPLVYNLCAKNSRKGMRRLIEKKILNFNGTEISVLSSSQRQYSKDYV